MAPRGGDVALKCLECQAYKFLYRTGDLAAQNTRRSSKYGFSWTSGAKCRWTCRADRHDQVVAAFIGDNCGALSVLVTGNASLDCEFVRLARKSSYTRNGDLGGVGREPFKFLYCLGVDCWL